MKKGLTNWQKVIIAMVCFGIAIIGFMIKLPSGFRHMDKELHASFYFLAAAFLNILFAKRKLVRHVVIFFFLFLFGMVIEHAQSYSNRFFRKRIHGRFDPQDMESNVVGLIAFSVLWILIMGIILVSGKRSPGNAT